MFHCNNSGQLVSSCAVQRPPMIHSRDMDGPTGPVTNQVPDITDSAVPESRCQTAGPAAAASQPAAESGGPADVRQGSGATPCPGAARPSPSSVISSADAAPAAAHAKLDAGSAAAAVAVLSRVAPVGPASSAGWRRPGWTALAGGGESTGSTGTAAAAGWSQPGPRPGSQPPPPAPAANSAAPGSAAAAAAAGKTAPNGQPAPPPSAGPAPADQQQQQQGQPQQGQQQQAQGQAPDQNASNGAGAAGEAAAAAGANGAAAGPLAGDSADLEKLKVMRAAITATDGWNSSQVNQETPWEVPASPEPRKEPANTVAWKLPGVNNGLDVWQTTLRNGGAPTAKSVSDQQWTHHIPQSNIGGTWGEDDDGGQGGSMWPGGPPPPPPPPQCPPGAAGGHWGGPAGPAAMWPGPAHKKDDWPAKHWDARANGDGWGNKPAGPWTGGGPLQHGPGNWPADHSPPMGRRQMPYDDWGNKPRGGGGGGWKDMGGPVPPRPGLPGHPGPPGAHMLSRMPPGGPPDHVKGIDSWGRPPRNGWGEAPPGPAPWPEDKWGGDASAGWGAKSKAAGWGEPEMEWAAKSGRAGPPLHPAAKAAVLDRYRTLTDQGFKPEDVELMLRGGGGGPALDEPADSLRMSAGGDWRSPDQMAFDQHSFPQMPPPQMQQYGAMQVPGAGHGGGNINPTVVQQLLRQQAQQQPSRFSGQPPSSHQQLRPLINQIQMAVHAGHLNPAILQQPMGPQTLILLNHLLSQIKNLDQLTRQQQHLAGRGNSPHLQSIQMEIMRVKSNISNIQSQIGSQQQAMMMKQQQQQQQQLYKPAGPAELQGLQAGLSELALREPGPPNPPESRLSKWKLAATDKPYRAEEEFSRAPGSGKASSPPLSLMGDSTWSSARPGGSEGGWPDGPAAAAAAGTPGQESKDGWPAAGGVQHQHSSYADLVPEFEPGKPWKMRSVEDDPAVTPGSVRSSLGLGAAGSQDLLGAMQPSKASPAGAADTFGGSTWSFNTSGKPGVGGAKAWDGADWSLKSRGPPPGLNKSAGGGGGGWSRGGGGPPFDQRSAFAPVPGGGWGGPGGSAWLLLRNLTAQIDGSTLKTLCMQHGPLYTFHMYLNHGVALVKYGSRDEAAKAQGALNNCVLSNTTIMAEAVTDEHASQVLTQLGMPSGQQGAGPPQQPPPATSAQTAAKPPASAAWSDMPDNIGTSMAWSNGTGNSSLWAAGGLEESSRGAYLPNDLLQ